jgi:hypothetical protein
MLRRRGLAGLAFNNTGDLQLSDDQVSTLMKLAEGFEPVDREVRRAATQLETDLTVAVRTGKFDHAKLDDDQTAIDKAFAAAQAQEVDAVNGLHATLDPDQRSALVAALRAKAASAREREPLTVADSPEQMTAADRNKRFLERITQDLTLDAKQHEKMAALLAKEGAPNDSGRAHSQGEMLKRLDAFVDAFGGPGFDAKNVDFSDSQPSHTTKGEMALLEKIAPILTPEQREKLAGARARARPL